MAGRRGLLLTHPWHFLQNGDLDPFLKIPNKTSVTAPWRQVRQNQNTSSLLHSFSLSLKTFLQPSCSESYFAFRLKQNSFHPFDLKKKCHSEQLRNISKNGTKSPQRQGTVFYLLFHYLPLPNGNSLWSQIIFYKYLLKN